MQEYRKKQISDLVQTRLPEFVRVDHPTLISFLEAYYEWLQISDRGGKLLNPMALGDVIDVDDTMDEFLTYFKKEYLLNFPEQLAISKTTGKPVDIRKLVKNIKTFYKAKGTEKSYEFLFRILYDVGVEFYYPKKDILRVSDGKWYERNALKISNSLGQEIFESVGRVVYQRNQQGQISASAKVVEVSTYQQGLYGIAELVITARNGTFATNKAIFFDVDEEQRKELKVYSVVSSVTVSNGGSGYAVGDEVIFTTVSGDSGIEAKGLVSVVSSTGAIRRIKLENCGINYNTAPSISINSLGGSGFSGTVNIGSICPSEGYYLNYDGRISTNKVIQDNHYYQDFSYVLKTEVVVERYREAVRRLVHPAGTAMFGQVLIKRCAKEDLQNSSSLIRYEVPIIGNYAPYTFKTFDNLKDWFLYLPEDATSLTAAGYDPATHDPLIRFGQIVGNPVTSGVSFILADGNGYLGVPTTSIPFRAAPVTTIPSLGGINENLPLGLPGKKNADPFWFIYEHPNRKITSPTIAQIWKNQIVDGGLTFGWQWNEHCSSTGSPPPSGWTSDFYGNSPVDKKYAFLKYDNKSEFRKITARSFFEMPIGAPFDCRSDYSDLTPPTLAIKTPKNNSIVEGEYIEIEIEMTNRQNNRYLPINQRVRDFEVLVDGTPYPTTPSMFIDYERSYDGFFQLSCTASNISYGIHNIKVVPKTANGSVSSVIPSDSVTILLRN